MDKIVSRRMLSTLVALVLVPWLCTAAHAETESAEKPVPLVTITIEVTIEQDDEPAAEEGEKPSDTAEETKPSDAPAESAD